MRRTHTLSLIAVAAGVVAFKIFETYAPVLAWAGFGAMMAVSIGWITFLYWTRGRSPK